MYIKIFLFTFASLYGYTCDYTQGKLTVVPTVINVSDDFSQLSCLNSYQDFLDETVDSVETLCSCSKKYPSQSPKPLSTLSDKAFPAVLDKIVEIRDFILFTNQFEGEFELEPMCNLRKVVTKNCPDETYLKQVFANVLDDKYFNKMTDNTSEQIIDILADKLIYESEGRVINGSISESPLCITPDFYFRADVVEFSALNRSNSILLKQGFTDYKNGKINKDQFSRIVNIDMKDRCGDLENTLKFTCDPSNIEKIKASTIHDDNSYVAILDSLNTEEDNEIQYSLEKLGSICKEFEKNAVHTSSIFESGEVRVDFKRSLPYSKKFNSNYFDFAVNKQNSRMICDAICKDPKAPYAVEGCERKTHDVVIKEMGCNQVTSQLSQLAKRCEYITAIYQKEIDKEKESLERQAELVEQGKLKVDEVTGKLVSTDPDIDYSAELEQKNEVRSSRLAQFLGVEPVKKPDVPQVQVAAKQATVNEQSTAVNGAEELGGGTGEESVSRVGDNGIQIVKSMRAGNTAGSGQDRVTSQVVQSQQSLQQQPLNVSTSRAARPVVDRRAQALVASKMNELQTKLKQIETERKRFQEIANSNQDQAVDSIAGNIEAGLSVDNGFSLGTPGTSTVNAYNSFGTGSGNNFAIGNGGSRGLASKNSIDYSGSDQERPTNFFGEDPGVQDSQSGEEIVGDGTNGTGGDDPERVRLAGEIAANGGSPIAAGNLQIDGNSPDMSRISRLFNNELSVAEIGKASDSNGEEKVVKITQDHLKSDSIDLVQLLRDRDDINASIDVINIVYTNPENENVTARLVPTRHKDNFTGYTIDDNNSVAWLSNLLRAKANLIR